MPALGKVVESGPLAQLTSNYEQFVFLGPGGGALGSVTVLPVSYRKSQAA